MHVQLVADRIEEPETDEDICPVLAGRVVDCLTRRRISRVRRQRRRAIERPHCTERRHPAHAADSLSTVAGRRVRAVGAPWTDADSDTAADGTRAAATTARATPAATGGHHDFRPADYHAGGHDSAADR